MTPKLTAAIVARAKAVELDSRGHRRTEKPTLGKGLARCRHAARATGLPGVRPKAGSLFTADGEVRTQVSTRESRWLDALKEMC
jgi:hypothetical protein